MVDAVREAQACLGEVRYGPSPSERPSAAFRRSLFVVQDIGAGEMFTEANVRSIRPSDGLAPSMLDLVIGRVASRPIPRGTPLSWELIGGPLAP